MSTRKWGDLQHFFGAFCPILSLTYGVDPGYYWNMSKANPTKADAHAAARTLLMKIVSKPRAPKGADAKEKIDLFKVKVAAAKILLSDSDSGANDEEVIAQLLTKDPKVLLAEAKLLGEKLTNMEPDIEPSRTRAPTGVAKRGVA